MKKFLFILLVFTCFCSLVACDGKIKESTPEDGLLTNELSEKEMTKDLDKLVEVLKANHVDFDHEYSEENFDKDVADLKAKLSTIDSEAFSFEVMKLCAKIGDAATRAYLDTNRKDNQYYLPVQFTAFEEGLFISKIDIEKEDYLGWKLLKVEETNVEDLINKLSVYYGGESHEYCKYAAKNSIPFWNMLNHAGVVSSKDVKLTVSNALETKTEVITLTAEKSGEYDDERMQVLANDLPTKYLGTYYHYKLIDNVLYIQYNNCAENPKQSLEKFMKEISTYLTIDVYKNVVVDFRYNYGSGNYTSGALLYSALKTFANDGGNVYCLMGENTQAHSIGAIIQIKSMCNAVLLGTPTVSTTLFYSHTDSYVLRNSVMNITFPTKTTSFVDGDNHGSLLPSVTIKQSYFDYINDTDSLLNYVIK